MTISYKMTHNAQFMKRGLPVEENDIPINHMAFNYVPILKNKQVKLIIILLIFPSRTFFIPEGPLQSCFYFHT